jgi:hypothetical protein
MDEDWGGVLDDEAFIDYWSPRVAKVLARRHITKLRIHGWKATDVEPLTPFRDQIERIFWDVRSDDIPDLSALGRLHRLNQLSLPGGVEQVDFSSLRNLKSLSVSADRPVFGNLRSCRSLKELSITGCRLKDLRPLAGLARLQELTIREAPLASLDGVEELTGLRRLALGPVPLASLDGIAHARLLHEVSLYLGRLTSVAPLTSLAQLKQLELTGCRKVRDLDQVGALANLQHLELDGVAVPIAALARLRRLRFLKLLNGGKVPSLAFLRDLRQLQFLYLFEATIVEDGDMSVLLELPALKEARFDKRRHYTHSMDDVQRTIKARRPHGRVGRRQLRQ